MTSSEFKPSQAELNSLPSTELFKEIHRIYSEIKAGEEPVQDGFQQVVSMIKRSPSKLGHAMLNSWQNHRASKPLQNRREAFEQMMNAVDNIYRQTYKVETQVMRIPSNYAKADAVKNQADKDRQLERLERTDAQYFQHGTDEQDYFVPADEHCLDLVLLRTANNMWTELQERHPEIKDVNLASVGYLAKRALN